MKHMPFLFVLASSVAIAQPYAPPVYDPNAGAMQSPDPLRAPGFVTLDRGDGTSREGAELSYLVLDGDADGTAIRFDVHGQFVDAGTGFGGYAYLPMSFVFVSGSDDSNFELAGAEVGGLLAKRLSPEMGIVARLGVVLPTANDDFTAVIQNAVTSYARATDIANAIPETTIRLSGSPLFRSGQLFGRIDVGVDLSPTPAMKAVTRSSASARASASTAARSRSPASSSRSVRSAMAPTTSS